MEAWLPTLFILLSTLKQDENASIFKLLTVGSVGKEFWRKGQQLAASAPVTNARLAAQAIRPALVN
jgi:hypothetical protein